MTRVQMPAREGKGGKGQQVAIGFNTKGIYIYRTIILENQRQNLISIDRREQDWERRVLDLIHRKNTKSKLEDKNMFQMKGNPIRLSANFSSTILQARRQWQNIFKMLKETYNLE